MKKPRLSLISRTLTQMKADMWLQVVAISTLSLCLVIMGMGLLVYLSMDRMLERVSAGAGLRLVLVKNASPGQALELVESLTRWPEVAGARYISPDEAMLRLSRRLGQEYDDLLSGLKENPLPATIELDLRVDAGLPELKPLLQQQKIIEEVVEARPWLSRLDTVKQLARTAIVVIGAVMFAALALVVTNTMRLAVYARREQLAVLDMLGAGRMYLRAPFIVEALLQAFLATAISSAILALALYFVPKLPEMPLWLGMMLPLGLPPVIPLCLFIMAIPAGLLGSWLGVGRALRLPEPA